MQPRIDPQPASPFTTHDSGKKTGHSFTGPASPPHASHGHGESPRQDLERAYPTCSSQPDPQTINTAQYGQAFEKGFSLTVKVLKSKGAGLDAEEIAQDAWVRGLERIEQLNDSSKLCAWVTSIAIKKLWDRKERTGRTIALSSDAYEAKTLPVIDPRVFDLYRAIKLCPPRQRTVVEQVYLLGRTPDEVAALLRLSSDAVYHLLSRGRQTLRRLMSAKSAQRGDR